MQHDSFVNGVLNRSTKKTPIFFQLAKECSYIAGLVCANMLLFKLKNWNSKQLSSQMRHVIASRGLSLDEALATNHNKQCYP